MNTILVDFIKDIEILSKKVHCYAYPKTMRSILTAAEKSPIASNFSDKYYYGKYTHISLTKLDKTLINLCKNNYLTYDEKNGKKRYKSISDNSSINSTKSENVDKQLSEEEIDEIISILDYL